MLTLKAHKAAATAVGVGGVLAILGATALLIGPLSPASADIKPEQALGLLSAQNGRGLALPDSVTAQSENIGDGGLSTASTKFVGEDAKARYWAGVDGSGGICVVGALKDTGMWGSSCAPMETFTQSGVGLAIESPADKGGRAEAYLVPDGANLPPVPSSLQFTATNLLTGDTRKAEQREIRSEDGKFTLRLVPDAGTPIKN